MHTGSKFDISLKDNKILLKLRVTHIAIVRKNHYVQKVKFTIAFNKQ